MGLWDTFRAACPLEAVLRPDIIEDYVKTALEHYKHAGQLPIWTLAGAETYQMIGLHSMPLITNAYLNGIRNFDTELALQAMTESAMKDSCGTSMGYFVGLRNYKKYGYVPCDMEMEAVARTLEYAYDDHAIAQFARMTGDTAKYELRFIRCVLPTATTTIAKAMPGNGPFSFRTTWKGWPKSWEGKRFWPVCWIPFSLPELRWKENRLRETLRA